jgi:DNA-binding transcriptional regulator LsrR (DeoR family)
MTKRLKAAIDDYRTTRAQYQEARRRLLPELKLAVEAGMSRTELARALGVSRQAVSKMLAEAKAAP